MQYLVLFQSYKASKCQVGEKLGQNLLPSDLRYKITPYSDILEKVARGGVLQPGRLQREKK